MNIYDLNILLVRGRQSDDSWMELLVIVIFVVISILSSIAKSISEKKKRTQRKAVSPYIQQKSIKSSPLKDRLSAEIRKIRPVYKGVERATSENISQYSDNITEISKEEKQIESSLSSEPVLSENIFPSEDQMYEYEDINLKEFDYEINLDETEELTRAIIYNEILGKPLSLKKEQKHLYD